MSKHKTPGQVAHMSAAISMLKESMPYLLKSGETAKYMMISKIVSDLEVDKQSVILYEE